MAEKGTVHVIALGGPTAMVDLGGLRIVTDPAFDPPGEQPRGLAKLSGPASRPDEVGEIDAVLLSHHHHPDNLDTSGRALLPRARLVVTTVAAADLLGDDATGLAPWSSCERQRPGGGTVTVTAVPAQHGPD